MIQTTADGFLKALREGDIGLIRSKNPFGWLQSLYASKFDQGAARATHGFYIATPPRIVESNGLFVSSGTILKNVGDQTQCWIFRSALATDEQKRDMTLYCRAALETGAHYSVGGIFQFGLQYLGIRKKVSDEGGVFCTELTSLAINRVGLPYISERKPFEIDPSYQLNWFLGEGSLKGWFCAAYYDGRGGYFVDDQRAVQAA